jgi:hypothetical protein
VEFRLASAGSIATLKVAWPLFFTATLSSFRYLDEAEGAQRRDCERSSGRQLKSKHITSRRND